MMKVKSALQRFRRSPAFAGCILFLAALILKEYPTRRQIIFSVLPIAGVIVMVLAGSSLGVVTPLGVVLMLLDCVVIGFYRLFNRWGSKDFTPFERTYVMLATGAVVFTLLAAVTVRGSALAAMMKVRMPIGTLMAKSHCQDAVARIAAPTVGPTAEANDTMKALRPMPRPSRRLG